MGSGRDKRKKHEDPAKAAKRALRQASKQHRSEHRHGDPNAEADGCAPEGFNNEEAIEVTLKKIAKEEHKKKTTVEKENVPPPSPRANVVFVAHPMKDQELVVFGGELWNGVSTVAYNDLYFYRVKHNQWTRVDTPINPSPRSSAQGITFKSRYLLVHGGEYVSQSQSQFMHFKDVWRFDFKTYQWDELKQLKGGPSCRSGHRMCLWKREAVVFGGFYDNAQECKYYNDLWILSDLEANGRWRQVTFPVHNDPPHPRSGHAAAICNDAFFVYGGYSTQKFNRFKKSEATVHHDLWMTTLSAEQPMWTKLRLGGIPPPMRAGVASVACQKKLFLFGGVVDIEAPGGKMVSSFHNDLFVFHMDQKRFYPMVLRGARKTKKATSSSAAGSGGGVEGHDLASELAALNLGVPSRGSGALSNASDSDDDDDDDDGSDCGSDDGFGESTVSTGAAAAAAATPDAPTTTRFSFEVNKRGDISLPHRRMDASLAVMGNSLYLFGGQFESGKKEITITDLFSLNLNTMDTWNVLHAQDLGQVAWAGRDSDSEGAASWESGSTVVSAVMFGDHGDDDEDEDEDGAGGDENRGVSGQDDGSEPPAAIHADHVMPLELETEVTPSLAAVGSVDGRTTGQKRGMQAHKAQLLAQLGAGAAVPTPGDGETIAQFYSRTEPFWLKMAHEALFGGGDDSNALPEAAPKVLRPRQAKERSLQARQFCRTRYDEATVLIQQLKLVEEREKEEAVFFRERREQKEREWREEEEARRRTEEDELRSGESGGVASSEEGDEASRQNRPPHRRPATPPLRGILKKSSHAHEKSESDDDDSG